jgi:glycosyltransferase involved in cell wall biosynthesis
VPRFVALVTGLGYAFTEGRQPRRLLSRLIAKTLYRRAFARASVAIFQNPDDREEFRRLGLLPAELPTFLVAGSGVDLNLFRPAPLPHQPAFLMIGRLLGDKGVREYADAAARLKRAYPGVRLMLAGWLDESPDSISQSELDDVIARGVEYLGRLDDVRPAIAAASIYVLPSYREGTPRSVLEAMAMGRAIITSDAPGCRQTVEEGVNGLLVPPRDADSLYRAMERLVLRPELIAPMGAQSRRMAVERFDARHVAEELLEHAQLN